METSHRQQGNERSGRVFVLCAIAVVAALGAYFALGMPGMDHSVNDMEDMEHTPELKPLSPRMFESRVAEGDALVVHVHGPAAETIEGTVEAITFDEIVEPAASDGLTADYDRMSEQR